MSRDEERVFMINLRNRGHKTQLSVLHQFSLLVGDTKITISGTGEYGNCFESKFGSYFGKPFQIAGINCNQFKVLPHPTIL